MAIQATKAALRKEMKKTLASLSMAEKNRQSFIVTKKVLDSDIYKSSKRISIYLSMAHEEIQTDEILKDILNTGKACFIPRYTSGNRDMEMVLLKSLEDYDNLPLTKWNIKQPADDDVRDDALKTGGLDLILVPGLAFTSDGKRLGRGKGYYDTFIENCHNLQKNPPLTIALAFKEQIVSDIPVGEKDRNVNVVFYSD